MRILILGAGRVGGAMALDLAAEERFDVTVADRSSAALQRLPADLVATRQADLANGDQVRTLLRDQDLIVGAVPGFMGFETVRTVLRAGKPIVDISFFAEDPFELDQLARQQGVTAIVDCGVAPGLPNLILGHVATRFERIDRFTCYVGGLPELRSWPFEYKAPFSPIDVIEEYTRPARIVQGGESVSVTALSGLELMDVPSVGTLEAFYTDGLRTLLQTFEIPWMAEKTMRYPGHAERMRMLREAGFFGTEAIEVDGASVRPLDLTAQLLFSAWKMEAGDRDLVALQVQIEGASDGRRVRSTWNLLDRYDEATSTTAMARTTGYSCTSAVRVLADGLYATPGITPPEYLGRRPECVDAMLESLRARHVELGETITDLD